MDKKKPLEIAKEYLKEETSKLDFGWIEHCHKAAQTYCLLSIAESLEKLVKVKK